MSDVSLKFVMDGGGAVSEVDKISQAEERLAATIKKGDVSIKAQTAAMNDAARQQLALLEEKFRRHMALAEKEGRSTTAIQSRYEREKLAVIDKHEREKQRILERGAQDAARNLDKGAASADNFSMSLGNIARQAAGILGVSLSINAVVQSLKEYDQRLDQIGNKQDDLMQSAVALAALQHPGMVSESIKTAAVTGAEFGIKAPEAFATFQRAQSVYGPEGAKDAAAATFEMAQLTGDVETAKENLKVAKSLNLTPQEFNAMIVGSSASSALDEAAFSRAAVAAPMFNFGGTADPNMAFAFMNALSTNIPAGELETYMKAGAVALTSESKLTKGIKGFDEMTGPERLEAMRQKIEDKHGVVTFETLQKAGITEQRQARALATVLAPEAYESQYGKTLAEAPTYADTFSPRARVEQIRGEDPLLEKMYLGKRVQAQADLARLFGPEADRAAKRDVDLEAMGAELGFGPGTDLETGKPKWWRRGLDFVSGQGMRLAMPSFGPAASPVGGMSPINEAISGDVAPIAVRLSGLEAALDRHLEGIKELTQKTEALVGETGNNTAATRENTGDTASQPPAVSSRNRNNE